MVDWCSGYSCTKSGEYEAASRVIRFPVPISCRLKKEGSALEQGECRRDRSGRGGPDNPPPDPGKPLRTVRDQGPVRPLPPLVAGYGGEVQGGSPLHEDH